MPEKQQHREKRSKNRTRPKRNGLQERIREFGWQGYRDKNKKKCQNTENSSQ